MTELHPAADRLRRARSFGTVAGEYQRGRPGYPVEAIEWILGPATLDVLDLGAGTGKLSAALVAAGHRVTAVEPLAEMRAQLAAASPGVHVLEGTAEQVPLAARSVDAVLAGAAFHWFETERALAEVVRVLRPPGVLALLGNSFDRSVPWQAELRSILGAGPLGRPGHWPERERLLGLFEQVEDAAFTHEEATDLARLRDYATSRSSFAVMAPEHREERLKELDRLWERTFAAGACAAPRLRWITRVRRCRGLRLAAAPTGSG